MKYLDKIFSDIPEEVDRYVETLFSITERINNLLKEKEITQKEFAEILDMSESQLSRILSAEENITIKTISRLEIALDEDLIQIPDKKVDISREYDIIFTTSSNKWKEWETIQLKSNIKSLKNHPTFKLPEQSQLDTGGTEAQVWDLNGYGFNPNSKKDEEIFA